MSLGDAIILTQLSLCYVFVFVTVSYLLNFFSGELPKTLLPNRVLHIVFLCPKKKVVWVDAGSVVTMMKNKLVPWVPPIYHHSNSVCILHFSI